MTSISWETLLQLISLYHEASHSLRNSAFSVGPGYALRSAIMYFGARLLRIRGTDVRSALRCFHIGSLKMSERYGKIHNSPF